MTVDETLKEIRTQCRLAMNGIASTSMREQGLNYKLNFGVSLLQIRDIAKRHQPNKELAEALWREDVRELKILATMLFPLDMFDRACADKWIGDIPNQEIREQICFNLLQKLPFASELAHTCINKESEETKATGYWLLGRLLICKNTELDTSAVSVLSIVSNIKSENVSLRNACLLALKQMGRSCEHLAQEILTAVEAFQHASNLQEQEIYRSLKFEFEYVNSSKD